MSSICLKASKPPPGSVQRPGHGRLDTCQAGTQGPAVSPAPHAPGTVLLAALRISRAFARAVPAPSTLPLRAKPPAILRGLPEYHPAFVLFSTPRERPSSRGPR